LPVSSGEKLCPICDSPLAPGSRKCSFCGTDLTIFDIEVEPSPKAPEPQPAARKSLEMKVDEVFSRPPPARQPPAPVREAAPPKPAPAATERPPGPARYAPPKIETPSVIRERPVPYAAPPVSEPAPSPMPSIEEKEEVPSGEFFECPQCGARVPSSASSCPKCGVLFAEEGADMFQCPACNTLVSMDARSCPGCGAIFVESAEAASEERVAPAAELEKEELEPPVTTVEPPPPKPKPSKEPAKEEEVKEKKTGFSLFKRRKKEEEPVEEPEAEEKEAVTSPAISPEKPAPKPVAPVKPAPALTPMRQAPLAATPGEPEDKGKKLSRMVAEVRPLMTLAQDKGVDISESMRLIDETYAAGRERQLDKAIELVQKSKTLLMERINANLAETLIILKEDLRIAQELGGDVSRPSTYVQEIERAKKSGDAEAAYVYADKVGKELQPIIGRYQDSKKKLVSLKLLIADCELFIVDTKEARNLLVEGTKAFESKDFDRVDLLVKAANDRLNKFIPARMSEEMKKAKDQLLEAKMRNVNITPMITILKSVTSLMKAGNHAQALKEMRQFRETMRKAS